MTKKYQNRYRVPSARLKRWDYRWNAAYYITICTQNREHYFGEIVDGKMQFSKEGEIVESEWMKTSEIRPRYEFKIG